MRRIFKFVFTLILVAAVFLTVVTAMLYVRQRDMLYYPSGFDRDSPHIVASKANEIAFGIDDVRLHGWLLNRGQSDLVIYYGGNGEELSLSLADAADFPDYAVLMLNYRGYGESGGKPSEKALVADALAVFDRIAKDYDRVILMGRSLGTGIAVQVAASRQVDSVILVTPYDSIANVAQKLYPLVPVRLLLKDKYDSLSFLADVRAPALFLVAGEDEIIAPARSRALADAWPAPYEWVEFPGAGHNSVSAYPEYREALRKFLDGRKK